MSLVQDLIWKLEEIKEKEDRLKEMVEAWSGDDPYDAAESDPGLQHELSSEIEAELKEFKEYVNENITDD